ncbi:hypothetical protein MAH1_37120 [Sessilibacter sp. MAH1]
MKGKVILIHLSFEIAVPILLLVNAFLIPEPYSHPMIYVALAPSKLMPFLENRELMSNLTQALFGRMTPNFVPIQMVFLVLFWFVATVVCSVLFAYIKDKSKNA